MMIRMAIVLLMSLVCLGCGADNPLNRQPIRGTVKFNGEAIDKGSIRFDSVSRGPTIAGGKIKGGSYLIPTEKGLAPGEYAVSIRIPDPKWDPKVTLNPKELAPPDYMNGAHKVTVTDGGSNVFDFDIRTP